MAFQHDFLSGRRFSDFADGGAGLSKPRTLAHKAISDSSRSPSRRPAAHTSIGLLADTPHANRTVLSATLSSGHVRAVTLFPFGGMIEATSSLMRAGWWHDVSASGSAHTRCEATSIANIASKPCPSSYNRTDDSGLVTWIRSFVQLASYIVAKEVQ